MNKLLSTGIALMSIGGIGIIIAICLEIITGEPVYYLAMKITAGLFGVGGPLLGWGLTRRGNKNAGRQ